MVSLNSWCNSYQARIYNQYVDTFQRIESYSYALHNYCKYNKWVLKVKKFTGTSYNPAVLIRNTNKPKYHTHNTMTNWVSSLESDTSGPFTIKFLDDSILIDNRQCLQLPSYLSYEKEVPYLNGYILSLSKM